MNVNVIMSKLKLYKEIKDNKLLTLSYGVYNGTIRLYINTVKRDDYKSFDSVGNLALTHINSRLFSRALARINDEKEGYSVTFNLYGAKFEDDKRVHNEKVLNGKLTILRVKTDGGLVNVIQITTDKEQKFSFGLLPTPYITIVENGELIKDKTKLSTLWTEAYSDTVKAMLDMFPEGLEVKKDKAY